MADLEVVVEPAIRTILAARATLNTLVGGRFHLGDLPVGFALPAIVIHEAAATFVTAHAGPAGVAIPRIQLDCWGTTVAQAAQVAAEATAALDGYSGVAAGVHIHRIRRISRVATPEAGATPRRVVVDFAVGHYTAPA